MDNQKNNIKRRKIIGFGIILLTFVIVYVWNEQRRTYIRRNGVWTILTIDRVRASARGGKSYTCHYQYRGMLYRSAGGGGDEIGYDDKGKRLFLQILPTDPSRKLIYNQFPVPSWFTLEAPPEGWKTRPTEEDLRKWQEEAESIEGTKKKYQIGENGATD